MLQPIVIEEIGALAEAEHIDDVDRLLAKLKETEGGRAGNKSLREALGWADNPDRYWSAHGRAIDNGLALKGTGKGGSIRLPESDTSLEDPQIEAAPDNPQANPIGDQSREHDLYPPAKRVIEESWAKSENYDNFLVEITAMKGRAQTGGKWTRPDVSILGVKAFTYLPHRQFEIVTFEIKPVGQTNVEGVFEALSHQQFATKSYVLFLLTESEASKFKENDKDTESSRILGTARKHGLGVITATNIEDWETWDEIVAAETCQPDPEQANRFIATCFTDPSKQQVVKWHK
jgi:hypothetical protein